MISMEYWEDIRLRCVRDREPKKRVARDLGLSPNTVRKYCAQMEAPEPPRYERRCKLDPFVKVIDALLESTPKITAKRIGAIIRQQYDPKLSISEAALRKYVARRRRELNPKEAFVRAQHVPADQAQFDFSPMEVIIAGVLTIVHVFVMRLSYSGAFFARASYTEDRPALFAGLLGAIKFFGGLPRVAIFDNPKTAVQRILRGRNRIENDQFRRFCGELALKVEFAAPRRGNEKGGVEGTMGYIEDNVFRPIPSYPSIEALNIELSHWSVANLSNIHSTHHELIGDRYDREKPALRQLPERLPKPCVLEYARVSKFQEVTVETNHYSVPSRYVGRHAIVEIYENSVSILVGDQCVAEHRRGRGKNEFILDPLHFIEVIARKHRSATRALAFAGERLPQPLIVLRDRLLERDGPTATKTWMAVLQLALKSSLTELGEATSIALASGTLDPQAIALILRQRDARSAALLDLACHRGAPALQAQVVNLEAYRISTLTEGTI
jgi:transposase